MAIIDINDLRRILVECAGADEAVDLSGDIFDKAFEELGYDSLALMETTAYIKHEYGIDLSDDEVSGIETPRQMLDLVNGAVTTSG